jgi:branched-chain amino acid transport system permease protein
MSTALVSGLASGAAYALFAMGIVIVYKTSRTFNFAQGEFATVAAYTAALVNDRTRLPYGVAIAVALLASVALAILIERLVIWPLRDASRVDTLVAVAAVATSIIALETILAGNVPRLLPALVGGRGVSIVGVRIASQQLLIVGVVAVAVVIAAFFFARAMTGVAIRATASEPVAARVVGIAVGRVSMLSWGIAGLLGGLGGLLLAPLQSLSPGIFTANGLVEALAAAVLGGLTSLSGAVVGGLIVGVVEALSFTYLGNSLPGAASVMAFGVVLVVLLVRPRGLLGGSE